MMKNTKTHVLAINPGDPQNVPRRGSWWNFTSGACLNFKVRVWSFWKPCRNCARSISQTVTTFLIWRWGTQATVLPSVNSIWITAPSLRTRELPIWKMLKFLCVFFETSGRFVIWSQSLNGDCLFGLKQNRKSITKILGNSVWYFRPWKENEWFFFMCTHWAFGQLFGY